MHVDPRGLNTERDAVPSHKPGEFDFLPNLNDAADLLTVIGIHPG